MPTSDIHNKYREVKENFENYFNTFVSLLHHDHPKSLQLAEQHFQNVTSYNLSSGKRIRGVLVVLSYMVFSNKNENSRKNLSCAYLIGWCVELVNILVSSIDFFEVNSPYILILVKNIRENHGHIVNPRINRVTYYVRFPTRLNSMLLNSLLHAGFLVLDDIIDNSTLRRGQPCWYCTQIDLNRGLIGVNDGLHLILSSKYLIHSLFAENQSNVDSYSWKDKNNVYLKLCKLFDEISYKTCSGQCLDVLSANPNNQCILNGKQNNLEFDSFARNYSPDVFEAITHWKTGFYTFYLPVACGMILAEVDDTDDIFKNVQYILLKLGNYFQAQDDYLDCFGDSEITGKVGTDIAEGKCTWLIVEALKYLSPEQYKILKVKAIFFHFKIILSSKTNYGKPDLKSQQTVRNLYGAIKLPEKYYLYEEQTKSEIMNNIQKFMYLDHFSFDPRDLFTFLVELLFQRVC
uniref:Farnesyl pyrophosphate synthase n=1 Tax=Schistosoma haematobium TaxID=6185 RepID=A0A094ZPF1_SCHHA